MRLISRRGLRTKLVVPILLITVPAIVAVVLSLGSLSAELLRESAERELAATAQAAANAVERWDQSVVLALQNLSDQPDIVSMDPQRQRAVLARMKRVYGRLVLIQTTAPNGHAVACSDDVEPIQCGDQTWFQMCLAGMKVTRAAGTPYGSDKAVLIISTPVRTADGRVVGVLSAVTDLASLADQLDLPNLQQVTTVVVDEQGHPLFQPRRSSPSAAAAGGPLEAPGGPGWITNSVRLSNGWSVVSAEGERQVMAHGVQVMRTAYWLATAGLLMVALLTWMVASRLIQPIRELTEAAHELAEGKWDRRVPEHREDELGVLAKAFNKMVVQLERGYRHIEEEVAQRTAQLRRSNEELQKAKAAAERANRAKDQFLANMSHEIRTPMTAILGFADIMLEPVQTQSDRQDSLMAIRRNARHLSDLINDVLDISKIEAGQMKLEQIPCDLPQLIAQTVSLVRPRVIEKGLEFKLILEGPVPRQIRTDPLRLRQILVNLIGNAQKFTERGSIELRVYCQTAARTGGNCMLRFSVTDTGIGMTPQQMSRLFRPFTQADESTTRRFGGTGLGLSICKSLANLLGGDVVARSRPGAGSTFTVTIDGGCLDGTEILSGLTEADLTRPVETAAAPAIQVRARILLVEDGPDNQRLITLHLKRAGAEVAVAEHGRIAVERLASEQFDLVLMDMQMPEMDGYEATRTLREGGCKLPIIALTAHALAEDRERCINAGCDDYLTKPIDRVRLLNTIRQYVLEPRGDAAKAEAPQTAPSPAPSAHAPSPPPPATAKNSGTDRITSSFAGDPDMKDVLEEFIAHLPGKVNRMAELLTRRELAELRRAVHQLKGAGGGYGFAQLTAQAASVEARLRENAAIETIESGIAELTTLIQRIDGYRAGGDASAASQQPSPAEIEKTITTPEN